MLKWRHGAAALLNVAIGLALTMSIAPAQAQDIDILMALPSPTLTFSSAFIAEDAGFYKKEGLKVRPHHRRRRLRQRGHRRQRRFHHRHRAGVPAGRGGGQRLFAIANLIDRPLVELVLRKDVADAAGITEKTPFAERAKALKGKTIGIQGVGSIVHAWERLVAIAAGSTSRRTSASRRWSRPACWPRW